MPCFLDPEKARRICTHECGHLIAAAHYNIPVTEVSIDDVQPYVLGGNYHVSEHGNAVISLAGAAAEKLIYGSITAGSDYIDQQMARDYLLQYYSADQLEQQLQHAARIADRLVRSERSRIERLAYELLRRGYLDASTIIELL